ncbi:MAG: hypothetical protein K2J82_11745 [Muribaculaceae bacterium]|nr:hypothetical protein [Muribaculaceae bacterium]MDE6755265.1 hypothetical protein [Muribaculaceae bacterium]
MDDKLFIIAIGGTGMRCLEAFVHLCAAGMFDNKEIDILTLDTDQANGNKSRVENLISLYNKVKTDTQEDEGGHARSNTFFSAKLNLYKFFTDYSTPGRETYRKLSDVNSVTQEKRDDNNDLSELFFNPDSVQEFNLSHGYRAQTHLGSLLMYHGIMEAAIKVKSGDEEVKDHEKALQEFLQLINHNSSNARVFVFGSVFGGTGASSIPVIPIALRDALKVVTGGNNDLNLNNVKFGSTLLTDYFKFNMPDDQQLSKDKVVANADNFTLNSQAALSFYDSDLTVQNSYKMLYHIGWPSDLKADYSQDQSGEVITGGGEQANECHVVELMSAAAAYDFFTREDLSNQKAKYVYRSIEESSHNVLRLTGASFVGADGPILEEKLGSLLSLSHLVLSRYRGGQEGINGTRELLDELAARRVPNYQGITDEQAREISDYLKEFAYKFLNGYLVPGWLHQINKSIGSGSFIFSSDALSKDVPTLTKVDPGTIYSDDRYNWDYDFGLGSKADRRLSRFIEILRSEKALPTAPQGTSLKEKFFGHLYNAITQSQKTSHLNQG